MKSITKLSVILLAAAALVAAPVQAQPDPAPGTTNTAPATPPPRRATQYRGTIASVDATGMILSLKGRGGSPETKVKISSTTKITKDKQPATFADAVVGLRASGSGKKDDDGVWVANTLNITTPPPAPTPAPPPPETK